MKTKHQQRIEEFMKRCEQAVPTTPTVPNEDVRRLRAKLILEEALETVEALGFMVSPSNDDGTVRPKQFHLDRVNTQPNLADIIDGCCDVSVVTIGTLSACGIPDDVCLEVVDRNNLAKFGPGSYRREDGKWMKPPGHTAPDFNILIDLFKLNAETPVKKGCFGDIGHDRILKVRNSYGEEFEIGQMVCHEDDKVGTATILGFEMSPTYQPEIRAITDKGYAHINFLRHDKVVKPKGENDQKTTE